MVMVVAVGRGRGDRYVVVRDSGGDGECAAPWRRVWPKPAAEHPGHWAATLHGKMKFDTPETTVENLSKTAPTLP